MFHKIKRSDIGKENGKKKNEIQNFISSFVTHLQIIIFRKNKLCAIYSHTFLWLNIELAHSKKYDREGFEERKEQGKHIILARFEFSRGEFMLHRTFFFFLFYIANAQ